MKIFHIPALFLLALSIPSPALAADLININTADAELLDTLPGIGPAYAARIIEYRTAHGLFSRIEDIQDVTGIGPSSFAEISSLITVADSPAEPPIDSSDSSAQTPSPAQSSAYQPPPAALAVKIEGRARAIVGVPMRISARVTNKGDAANHSAEVMWSFGDGSSASGREVEKTFRYAGKYVVVAEAIEGTAKDSQELIVTVTPALVHVATVPGEGVVIANESKERLDLSGWRLASPEGTFHIPRGTILLPSTSTILPASVTNLPATGEVSLQYPGGALAARSAAVQVPRAPAAPAEQLLTDSGGYESIQKVEPITSVASEVHEQAVAPAVPTFAVGTAGAAFAASSTSFIADDASPPGSFFRSPWFLTFLGVVALAGGAFILL